MDLGADAQGRGRRRCFYGKTRREVVDQLVEARALVARGELPPAGKLPLGQFLDRWLGPRRRGPGMGLIPSPSCLTEVE